MVAAIIPLAVTIPMALILRSYWALIIGNIAGATVSAVFLLILSKWHPNFYYSWSRLHRMFSFSFWSLCEGLAHWTIFWFDTFLVSYFFTSYYLGLYKNSTHIMISLFGMVTATISPVLLSVLSRMKSDAASAFNMVLNIEKLTIYLLLPLGIILYFYRHLAVSIMFGEQWIEAANIVGAWALMMVGSIIFYTFPAEAFKSQGIPKYLFFYQIAYLIFLVPLCCYAISIDFWSFVYTRTFGIFIQIALFFLWFYKFIHWNRTKLLYSSIKPIIAATILALFCYLSSSYNSSSIWIDIIMITASLVVYFITLFFFRNDIRQSIAFIKNKNIAKG